MQPCLEMIKEQKYAILHLDIFQQHMTEFDA